MKNAIQSVIWLRTAACMLVVVCHARIFSFPPVSQHAFGVPDSFPDLIRLAVALFFMMTGYLLTRSEWYEFGKGHSLAFLKKRVGRVLPMYYLFTLAAVVSGMLLSSGHGVVNLRPVNTLLSLLFIPAVYISDTVPLSPVLCTGWAFCYSFLFYLIFAVGLRLPRRSGLATIFIAMIMLTIAGQLFKTDNRWFAFYTDPILLYFLSGMLCFILQPRLSTPWPHNRYSLLMVCGLTLLAVRGINEPVQLIGLTMAFFLLTFFSFKNVVRSPVARLATEISLAVWTVTLSHTLFMDALANVLPLFIPVGSGPIAGWMMTALLTAGATGMGYLIYWLVEKRAAIKLGVKVG